MEIRVACLQSDVFLGHEEKNIKKALAAIDNLFAHIEQKIHFLCFPELFTAGFDYNYFGSLTLSEIEQSFYKTITLFSKKALKYNVHIQLGSLLEAVKGKVYNSAPLINPQGKLLGTYHKNHLFPLMNENSFFSPGRGIKVFSTDSVKIGIAICFDIRFPSLFRKLAIKGAEIVFVPAQFPVARIKHWEILLRARAIENQYFVVGINRIGKDPQNIYRGHTVILNPLGENLIEDERADIYPWIIGSFDTNKIKYVRAELPSFSCA